MVFIVLFKVLINARAIRILTLEFSWVSKQSDLCSSSLSTEVESLWDSPHNAGVFGICSGSLVATLTALTVSVGVVKHPTVF